MKYKIYNQDVIEWAKSYEKQKFHALLSDAPYHLTSITKRFGKKGSAPVKFGKDRVFQRSSKGFMQTTWDGGDVAFRAETWEALCEHLYPGGFGMVFSASRNWHRLAVAIEDAGMIIHPTIFGWLNGQGFPKATNISKQIDKDKNNSRSEDKRIVLARHIKQVRTQKGISKKTLASWFSYSSVTENWERLDSGGRWPSSNDYKTLVNRMGCNESLLEDVVENERLILEHSNNGIGFSSLGSAGYNKEFDVSKSMSNLGATWEGHRYGLQALKPAVEPIIVFQKPYEGRPLDDIVTTGAGAINIDGGRIPLNGDSYVINTFDDGAKPWGDGAGHKFTSRKIEVLSNHSRSAKASKSKGIYGDSKEQETHQTDGQKIGRWPANFILGESVAPLLDRQTGTLQSGKMLSSHKRHTEGSPNGIYGKFDANAPLKETIGDSGGASRFFYNVQEQIDEADPIYYCGKVNKTERNAGLDDDNIHPTMKPIALAKYLATLLLPPEGYAPRRILVPFSGVGSEMIGAMQAGWEQIVGIEFDTENGYVDMAHKRMEYWNSKK